MRTPKEIAEFTSDIGVVKAKLPTAKMFILGILAGAFIALAASASNTVSATVANPSVAKLLCGLVFPLGLVMVLLAGSELFTGNSLMLIALLDKRIKPLQLLKNWVVVYMGNLVGGVFIAVVSYYAGQFSMLGGKIAEKTVAVAQAKADMTFLQAMLLGVLCNILVCIAVWISFGAKTVSGKIIGCYMPIMAFVLCGHEHSVANMYYLPAGLLASDFAVSIQGCLVNLGAVTLGNVIGGGLLIAVGYRYIYRT